SSNSRAACGVSIFLLARCENSRSCSSLKVGQRKPWILPSITQDWVAGSCGDENSRGRNQRKLLVAAKDSLHATGFLKAGNVVVPGHIYKDVLPLHGLAIQAVLEPVGDKGGRIWPQLDRRTPSDAVVSTLIDQQLFGRTDRL